MRRTGPPVAEPRQASGDAGSGGGAAASGPGYPLRRRTGVGAVVASFAAASNGVMLAWKRGRNFRIQLAAAYAAVVLASWLGLPPGEVAAIAVAAGLVLATETLNTAVEVLVDLVTREYHPLARTAKDLAAGAVLLTAVVSLVVALLALVPEAARIPGAVAAAWRLSPARVVLAAAAQAFLVAAVVRFRPPAGWAPPSASARPPAGRRRRWRLP